MPVTTIVLSSPKPGRQLNWQVFGVYEGKDDLSPSACANSSLTNPSRPNNAPVV